MSINGIGNLTPSVTPATSVSETMATEATPNSDSIVAFWSRYEQAKHGDTMKNVLIQDVIIRYEHLLRKHNEYVEAHQKELAYAKNAHEREQQLQAGIAHLQRILNNDPFVLVLVDGDGMVFEKTFLNQGKAGGVKAAAVFHKAVAAWAAESIIECPADVKVVVRVYANLNGLANTCVRAGLVDSPAKIESFAHGLTSAQLLFDFIDVGPGKDLVASKIKESFTLHLLDYHCRQILLGCGHQKDYTELLQNFSSDEEVLPRVTLLEGVPFEKDLQALPFKTHRFDGIFNEHKICTTGTYASADFPPYNHTRGFDAAQDIFTARTNTQDTYSPRLGTRKANGQTLLLDNTHLRSNSPLSLDGDSVNSPKTWASLAAQKVHSPLADLPVTVQSPRSVLLVKRNKNGQRLDEPMTYDREEVQRVKKLKCCNQHYIGYGCCHLNAGKPDKCPHNHHFKLSATELKYLRVVARETPCRRGHDCEDPNCIYGHRCPFPEPSEGSLRGAACLNGENCRFPKDMHGMDNMPAKAVKTIVIR